ncbi:MAG: hypothetical protein ACI4UM_02995 [Succinivibrio sp.]
MIYQNKLITAGLYFMTGLSIFLNGCSLEDETAEQIVLPVQEELSEKLTDNEAHFFNLAQECSSGNTKLADEAVDLYLSSLQPQDISKDIISLVKLTKPDTEKLYTYQARKLNLAFEKCLTKTISDGAKEYSKYYITKAAPSARISQYFYANKDYSNGSYWALRVVNLLGKSRAYYILGLVFISDNRTVSIGADYLSESARLGNENAKIFLSDNVLKKDVFDLIVENDAKY